MEWEPKVLAILNIMHSTELQAELVLECMRRTKIPWSANLQINIEKVVGDPVLRLHRELKEQLKLIELKQMIALYGVTTFK
jgi:hypothetical protein